MSRESKGAALVTGGAIRIGREMALALAGEGYDIALHYNRSGQEAEATAAEIRKLDRKCLIFREDLSDISKVEKFLDNVVKTFSNLNLLVNNASIFENFSFVETDVDILDRHMSINFKAPFFLSQGFARRGLGGQIVNILDTYVTRNATKRFAYMLSKKALYEFTMMAAKELAPGIRVNGLAIGTTEISKDISAGYLEDKKKALPMKRIVTLEEITDALLVLVKSNGITGQVVFVDGGEHLI